MVVHSSYTINLCHPIHSTKFESSLKSLIQDLESSFYIGPRCLGVIIHMGKNITTNGINTKDALMNYVKGIHIALLNTPETTNIILETGASQGSEVGSDIDGLAYIYSKIKDKYKSRVFFCIDTCHIWATGYDISTKNGVTNFFEEFDKKIGISKIKCIHFNDSKTKLNSHVDRHADLGYGHIGEQGLKYFVKRSVRHSIPIIMETPLDSVDETTNQDITFQQELKKVVSWIKK